MSGMVAEAIRLGARLSCATDGELMTVQGQTGAWGHRTKDGWHVVCPCAYGGEHIEQCEKKEVAE